MNSFLAVICLIAAFFVIKRIIFYKIGRSIVKNREEWLHTLHTKEWRTPDEMIVEMNKLKGLVTSPHNTRAYMQIIRPDTFELLRDGLINVRIYIPYDNEDNQLPKVQHLLTQQGLGRRTNNRNEENQAPHAVQPA